MVSERRNFNRADAFAAIYMREALAELTPPVRRVYAEIVRTSSVRDGQRLTRVTNREIADAVRMTDRFAEKAVASIRATGLIEITERNRSRIDHPRCIRIVAVSPEPPFVLIPESHPVWGVSSTAFWVWVTLRFCSRRSREERTEAKNAKIAKIGGLTRKQIREGFGELERSGLITKSIKRSNRRTVVVPLELDVATEREGMGYRTIGHGSTEREGTPPTEREGMPHKSKNLSYLEPITNNRNRTPGFALSRECEAGGTDGRMNFRPHEPGPEPRIADDPSESGPKPPAIDSTTPKLSGRIADLAARIGPIAVRWAESRTGGSDDERVERTLRIVHTRGVEPQSAKYLDIVFADIPAGGSFPAQAVASLDVAFDKRKRAQVAVREIFLRREAEDRERKAARSTPKIAKPDLGTEPAAPALPTAHDPAAPVTTAAPVPRPTPPTPEAMAESDSPGERIEPVPVRIEPPDDPRSRPPEPTIADFAESRDAARKRQAEETEARIRGEVETRLSEWHKRCKSTAPPRESPKELFARIRAAEPAKRREIEAQVRKEFEPDPAGRRDWPTVQGAFDRHDQAPSIRRIGATA